jgi:hypothetical protein
MCQSMTLLVDHVRGTVSAAVGVSRHLLWYVGYQVGSASARDPKL